MQHGAMRTWTYVLAVAAVGCVTSRPVMAPDGSQGHYIECPRSIDRCMDKAAELCPAGYNVIDSGGRHGAIAQTNYQTGQTVVTPTFRGNMTISCRARTAQGQ